MSIANFSLFYLLISYIINLVNAQLNELKIGETLVESIDKNKFYKIEFGDFNYTYLILNVKPSDNYEKYSDPDIFVSKTNSFPAGVELSDWYSVNVGEDTIPIFKEDLENSTYLYVSVKCEGPCEYNITAYFENKLDLHAGRPQLYRGDKYSARIFHYNHTSEVNKFEIYALSDVISDMKMKISFVYGNNITTNVFTEQSWYNGYSAIIDTSNYFHCAKCYFRVEIHIKPFSMLVVGVQLKNIVAPLIPGGIQLGAIDSEDRDCYNYTTLALNNTSLKNETAYIIRAHSFLDQAKIYLTKNINDTTGDKTYFYKNDLVFKLYHMELKDHLICVTTTLNDRTSYYFTITPEDDIEKSQQLNYLINGMMLYGYLPSNNVTSYRHWRIDTTSKSLDFNLKVVSGNPVLYAYVCMDFKDCHFNKTKVDSWTKAGLLFSSSRVNDEYHIKINNEQNACYLKTANTGRDDLCSAVAVVSCEGINECQYTISMSIDEEISLLQERVKVSKFIVRNSTDYYKIINKDKNVQKLYVVLHSHTGDSDLIGSTKNKKPELDFNSISSASAGNRDVITFTNTNTVNLTAENNTLPNEFYVAVKGYTYSYYTIYYYTSISDAEITSIDSGTIYPDLITFNNKLVVYNFYNRDTSKGASYILTFNSLNCIGDAYFMKSPTETSFKLNNYNQNSQYIMNKDHDAYKNSKGYLFGFKPTRMDTNSTSENEKCLIYVGGVEEGRELVLNEGIPHIYTFEKSSDAQIKQNFSYVYPHTFENNVAIITLYFNTPANLKLSYRIGSSTFSYSEHIFHPISILINKEILEKNCNTGLCNIHILIENININVESGLINNDITYRILAKSSNNIPTYIEKNHIKYDSTTPGVYQYYYTDVNLNESGEIFLNEAQSVGRSSMVARIIRKEALPEPNSDYKNIKLPKISDTHMNLVYDNSRGSITYNSSHTGDCYQGCEIYFGVYHIDKFAYNDYITQYNVIVKSDSVEKNPIALNVDSVFNGRIYNSTDFDYFKFSINEEVESLTISLYTSDASYGDLYVKLGERKPSRYSYHWMKQGESFKKNTLQINLTDEVFKSNHITSMKGQSFIVGVAASNVTVSFNYFLYAHTQKAGLPPLFHINPGFHQTCEKGVNVNENYCDFFLNVHDTTAKLVIFYANIISDLKEQATNITYYVNIFNKNVTEYFSIKNDIALRPRLDKSQIVSTGLHGKPIFIYDINANKQFGKQFLIVISVYTKTPGTVSILSNVINDNESVIKPKSQHEYLVLVNPKKVIDVNIDINSNRHLFYMVKFKRLLGSGIIDYNQNKQFTLARNSSSTQFVLAEKTADLNIFNKNDNDQLILLMRYDGNLNANFDEIEVGHSQQIYYPNAKNDFPVIYYFSLKSVSMDLTVNFQFKDFQSVKTGSYMNDYHVTGFAMDGQFIIDRLQHSNTYDTFFKNMGGVHLGKFDRSLQTGRITFPANKYGRNFYAVLIINPVNHNFHKLNSFTVNVMAFPENSLHYGISLSQHNYFYSSIDTNTTTFNENRALAGHVYKLTKERSDDTFLVIELAACSGIVEYALRDIDPNEEILIDRNPSMALHTSKHTQYAYDHFGKKIIEVTLTNDNKDLVLVILAKNKVVNSECDSNLLDSCQIDYNVDYAVRYRSFASRNEFAPYSLADKGLISSEIKEGKVYINKGQLLKGNGYAVQSKYHYRIFHTSKIDTQMSSYDSICFAHNVAMSFYTDDYVEDFVLPEVPTNVNIVVSVLAESYEPGENYGSLLVYSPIKIMLNSSNYSVWLLFLFILLTLILVAAVFILFRKYRQTKLRLDYETNDIRNLASIPKSTATIAEMRTVTSKEKYTSLNETG